jgi:hypothetical protein
MAFAVAVAVLFVALDGTSFAVVRLRATSGGTKRLKTR